MGRNENAELFEKASVHEAVAQLTIPVIISSLVIVVYSLADTYFVSLLNDSVQNAAVTLVTPVLFTFNVAHNLFGMGAASMMSRSLGSRDYKTVYQCAAFGFYCALCWGVLFSILCIGFQNPLLRLLGADWETWKATREYMFWTVFCGAAPAILNVVLGHMFRAEGDSVHASIGSMSGCILNMILDFIFITPHGLNMGAEGAGLATFLSNCVSCLYFFVILYWKRGRTYVCIHPKQVVFKKDIVLGIGNVGVPAAIQNLLNVTGMTLLNYFTASFGADAVAGMGITQKIHMVPIQIALGFSQGIMPLVSYSYGAGDFKRMKQTILFAVKLMLPPILITTAGYYIGAGKLVGLFMDNVVIVDYGTRFLRGFCLSLPFLCTDSLITGVFQALGMGKTALTFAILRKAVLEIPAILLLNFLFPLYGIPYAQLVTEIVLAVAGVIMLFRIFRREECVCHKSV